MKKGYTLTAAIFILMIMTLLAITTATYISSDAQLATKHHYSQKAFYIASSGLNYYLKQLVDNDDWTALPSLSPQDFSGGVFTLTTTDELKSSIVITSTGTYTVESTTYTRTIRVTAQAGGLHALASEYIVYWSGSGNSSWNTTVQSNVYMGGSVLVNNNLLLDQNTTVSGDAYAAGNITGVTSGVTGTIEANYTMPDQAPTLDTSYFDSQIAVAATYPPGNKTYSGSQVLSGTTYINGDIEIDNSANISVTGAATLVATGKFTINNYATVGNNLTVIINNKIDVKNDLTVGTIGIWYSGVGLEVGNNVTIGGTDNYEGSRFITPGNITVKNNSIIDGLFYASGQVDIGNNLDYSGLILTGYLKEVGDNATMSLAPETLDWNAIEEIVYQEGSKEGGIEITSWDEVY